MIKNLEISAESQTFTYHFERSHLLTDVVDTPPDRVNNIATLLQSESHHHEFESLAQYIPSIRKIVDDINSSLLIPEKWYVDFEELPENHVTVRLYDEHDKSLYQQEPSIDDTWHLELQ